MALDLKKKSSRARARVSHDLWFSVVEMDERSS
jgi:hypothetical protein